ncbi:MAG: phytanoyl-CoA dioxygenase family protein [Proteobacteria bacterium]|nr:phytanoyl-CoA dioxygenase family protein [Pseudomonadota bacterium]
MISVRDEDIRAYREDGAICLRGVFDPYWRDLAARGIEFNIKKENWGRRARYYDAGSDNPGFFQDACNCQDIAEYREYVYDSPAAEIAARLTKSAQVNIFFDNVMIKAPGNQAPTPWHHDVPYWPVEGHTVCSLWMPLDPITMANTLRFVKGSQRWGKRFVPSDFGDRGDAGKAYNIPRPDFEPIPDFDARAEEFEFLSWEMKPGDAIAFDGYVIHGAPGNPLPTPRRAMITRFAGTGCTYAGDKHAELGPPFPDCTLPSGAPLTCDIFPVVWPPEARTESA